MHIDDEEEEEEQDLNDNIHQNINIIEASTIEQLKQFYLEYPEQELEMGAVNYWKYKNINPINSCACEIVFRLLSCGASEADVERLFSLLRRLFGKDKFRFKTVTTENMIRVANEYKQ
ncbi:MAG: hypothetical protein EZS28_022515 [Streblomastix strix]|uniref:HAT C-terminal dimerisation domain-containing protein n=1 Tax=Streblomastix strix TaxID=222440 RepID=A0A5J4VHZ9_9EUKA|nr:MAG: hypothetical protein EZS28_022515 [Streblomastix strix]